MLRRALTPVHRWVGLTLGLVALVSAVTGAGMAFRKTLDPVVYPQLFHTSACARALPMDAFVAAARAAHPGGAVDYVRVRGEADAPIVVRFTNKDTLYFDRCTARLTGAQNRYEGVFGQLERIHRLVFVPNHGWVMGAGALSVLFILGGMGLFLWWPRKPRRFSQGFKLDRRLKGPMFTLGLHRTIGGWAAVMLMVSATTALPNAYESLKAALIDNETMPKSTPPAGLHGARLPMEAAWRAVTKRSPQPREVLMHMARKPKDPIEIYIIDADAPHINARTYLYLDAYSGRVLRFAPYGESSLTNRLYYWMLSVHTGQIGGLFGQFLLFTGALAVPILAYTGISSYLRRRFPKRKPVRRGAVQSAAARP